MISVGVVGVVMHYVTCKSLAPKKLLKELETFMFSSAPSIASFVSFQILPYCIRDATSITLTIPLFSNMSRWIEH